MKQLLNIILILNLSYSPLWAEKYDIWELETEFPFSKCMSQLVDFPGYKIVPPQREKKVDEEKDEDPDDEEEEEEQYPHAETEGMISLYVRSKAIAHNVKIMEDIEIRYQKSRQEEYDGPFFGKGQDYVLFNKEKNKYYYCFVEWDERMIKWNRNNTWITRMCPRALDFLDCIPRIMLAPLIHIGEKVFLQADTTVAIYGSAIPHCIDKKAKKPRVK